MKKYVVTLHTRLGRQFIVEAEDEEAAIDSAMRGFVEEGDDGTVEYEAYDYADVEEAK